MAATKTIVATKRGRVDGAMIVYQLELVRCGKRRCSTLHGPYWYAYWTKERRTGKRYIGKRFKRVSREDLRRRR